MRPTFTLGRISGIPVGLHWSAVLTALYLASNLSSSLGGFSLATIVATGYLASILVHELAHALVAQRHRVPVHSITLWLLGGVARLDGEAVTPKAEFQIAAAGPAASLALGGALLAGSGMGDRFGSFGLVLAWLGVMNLVLGIFNLLPGSPLDGGRLVKAALWRRNGDREVAALKAAKAGRVLGWALVLGGLFGVFDGWSTFGPLLIGWFVLCNAKAEQRQVERVLAARRPAQSPKQPPWQFRSVIDV